MYMLGQVPIGLTEGKKGVEKEKEKEREREREKKREKTMIREWGDRVRHAQYSNTLFYLFP